MEKKAVEYTIKARSINPSLPPTDEHSLVGFLAEIKAMLDDGWDIFSSQTFGLDTGGGASGTGNIMVFVTLVKYGYFEVINREGQAAEQPA